MLEKYFSRVPAGPKPEEMTTVEPKQFAEKTVIDPRADPALLHRGLSPAGLSRPGRRGLRRHRRHLSNGRVSRLYRDLVEQQQIAAEAEGFNNYPGDKYPSLFSFYAVPLPGHTPAEMRDALHKEIEKLKTTEVSDAELAMFKTRSRADLLRGLDDNQGLADALAEYQTRYGDWRELFLELDRVDKVTKADIRRVANATFAASNRTSAEIDTETPKAAEEEGGRRAMRESRQLPVVSCQLRPRSFHVAGLLFVALFLAVAAQAQQSKPWEQIPTPKLHEFKPHQPVRIELKNGVVIFLQEDHELPFVYGSVLIPGGSRDEDANKTGLVDLYGQSWRTSGTAKMDGDAMDDLLEAKAAHIETDGDEDSTSLSWDSLKGDADQVFALAMDLLFHPKFSQEKLELARKQEATGIVRRNDEEDAIAGREASKLVYGKDSPYTRQPELATIGAVTLNDLKAWHKRTLRGKLIVGIGGDFDAAAMEAKAARGF